MKFVAKTTKYTLFGHKRSQDTLKQLQTHNPFWYNSTSKTSGYIMLTERTALDYRRLLDERVLISPYPDLLPDVVGRNR
jgi:hypothetical protein